jgi:uncharacterized protein (TIGR02117 family)
MAPVALYLLAALAGSHIPRNADWRQPAHGIAVYVASNGVHAGLIVPRSAAGIDWHAVARPQDLPGRQAGGAWLLFGWGDRDFYLNTPQWRDLTLRTAVTALVGSGGSLVHVDHLDSPADVPDIRKIMLTPSQYRRLSHHILTSFAGPSPAPLPGYGVRDVFYHATGRYSLLRTCNTWVGDALAAAGVRTGLWTPFAGGVMRWYAVSAWSQAA